MKLPAHFQPYLNDSYELNVECLSPRIKDVLENYLVPLNKDIPKEALLNVLIAYIAQVGAFNRLRIKSSSIISYDETTLANFYSIIFMSSGSGKDRAQGAIKGTLLKDIYDAFEEKVAKYVERRNAEIIKEAEEKYDTKAAREDYIRSNKPRYLNRELGDATLEGFIALREAYSRAEFGGTFAQISEFGDFILSENNNRNEFLTAVTEVYDNGDSKAKIIKGEKDVRPVYGVPSNIVFHTSPSGLLDGRGHDKLMAFFNRGLARRSFICYPIDTSLEEVGDDELDAYLTLEDTLREEAKARSKEYIEFFKEMDDRLKYFPTFKCESDTEIDIRTYELYNRQRAKSLVNDLDIDGVRAELTNRHWKTLKLACIIAAFEHPIKPKVTREDFLVAVQISEISGNHLDRFYDARPLTDPEKLFNYFLRNKDQWLSKSDITAGKFRAPRLFKQWFESVLPLAMEIAQKRGYKIEDRQSAKQWREYRITKDTIIDEMKLVQDLYASGQTITQNELYSKYNVYMTYRKIEEINLEASNLGLRLVHEHSKKVGNSFKVVEMPI